MKLIIDGNCLMVCPHISIYYNDIENIKQITVQCEACEQEYFPAILFKEVIKFKDFPNESQIRLMRSANLEWEIDLKEGEEE